MAYEAQIAGLGDAGRGPRSMAVRALQRRSRAEIAERRAAAVAAVRAVAPLEFVNGGGTGSLESTAAEAAVTEVTAGSGLFGSALFDHYRAWHPQPAALFALPVVRRPGPGVVTVLGGGWVASGPSGRDRLPCPWLPTGLRLDGLEGAGEVQTPLRGSGCRQFGRGRPRVVPARQGRRALRTRERVARRRRRHGGRAPRRPTVARARPSFDGRRGRPAGAHRAGPARSRTPRGRRRPGGIGQDDVRRRALCRARRRPCRAHGRPVRGLGRRPGARCLAPAGDTDPGAAARRPDGALPEVLTGARTSSAPGSTCRGIRRWCWRASARPPGRSTRGPWRGCGWRCPPTCGLDRGIARDGLAMREHWLRFQQTEDAHFASDRTRDRADVIVDGTA